MPLSPRPRLGARDNGDVERDIHDHDNTDDEHVENQRLPRIQTGTDRIREIENHAERRMRSGGTDPANPAPKTSGMTAGDTMMIPKASGLTTRGEI